MTITQWIRYGQLGPGLVVAVKVDPADPHEVAIDVEGSGLSERITLGGGLPLGFNPGPAVPGQVVPGQVVPGQVVPRQVLAGAPVGGQVAVGGVASGAGILATGTRGRATIRSALDTGRTGRELGLPASDPGMLDDPIYILWFDVQVDGQTPFAANVGQRVPRDKVGLLAPGTELPVAVDLTDPTRKVAVDWDAC